MHHDRALRGTLGPQIAGAVVRAHSPTLSKPHEDKLDVLSDARPSGDVAIEQILTALDAGRPKVPTGWQNLEVEHCVKEGVSLGVSLV
jgi:hypothetical protein